MSNKHGFRSSVYEKLPKRCQGCNKKFETRDPTKRFCTTTCRIKNWNRYNKDKLKIIQKRFRDKQRYESKVQD